jgi:hypothetical protein
MSPLLPQPGGFEGVGFGLEPAMPNDPSISQRPDVSGVGRDRLVVCPAHQNEANGDDDFFPYRGLIRIAGCIPGRELGELSVPAGILAAGTPCRVIREL